MHFTVQHAIMDNAQQYCKWVKPYNVLLYKGTYADGGSAVPDTRAGEGWHGATIPQPLGRYDKVPIPHYIIMVQREFFQTYEYNVYRQATAKTHSFDL